MAGDNRRLAVACAVSFEPRHSFADAGGGNAAAFNPSGIATAMAAVNSLIPVCDLPAGFLHSADLPLPRWRGAA